MRLDRSEIEISNLIAKVERGELDLQPNFQRGEVWPEPKKRRLVDTILRNWYIPAIHIVVNDDLDQEEVLDGQQRLRAIMEFMNDQFPVDGWTQPHDEQIKNLHGTYYSDLPPRVKSRFRRFTIPTVRLREFGLEEPGELFFRLNQLTALTSAEQRNALIGEPRNQIKDLALYLENSFDSTPFGFSNFRLAYDEVLARLALTLESADLSIKVTARALEDRYRRPRPFSRDVIGLIRFSIDSLSHIYRSGFYSKLNKASLFSWLFFIADPLLRSTLTQRDITRFYVSFESARTSPTTNLVIATRDVRDAQASTVLSSKFASDCALLFNDRAFARVNDVSSILLRDLALNLAYAAARRDRSAFRGETRSSAWAKDTFHEFRSRLISLPSQGISRATAESELAELWKDYREARKA